MQHWEVYNTGTLSGVSCIPAGATTMNKNFWLKESSTDLPCDAQISQLMFTSAFDWAAIVDRESCASARPTRTEFHIHWMPKDTPKRILMLEMLWCCMAEFGSSMTCGHRKGLEGDFTAYIHTCTCSLMMVC